MTDALNQLEALRPTGVAPSGLTPPAPPTDGAAEKLNFSKHLAERLQRRRLDLSQERMNRLEQAVDKAAGKGSRDSVVFLDELALLVNVQSRTVLTALQTDKMKDGVFTNIDSVVVG